MKRKSGDRSGCKLPRGKTCFDFAISISDGPECRLRLHRSCTRLTDHPTSRHGIRSFRRGDSHAQVELLEDGVPVATTVTDAKGQYSIPQKPGSNQSLRVTAQGFSMQQKSISKMPTGEDLTVDFTLALAAFSEQVTVTSTGLPTPQSQLGAAVTVIDTSDLQGTQEMEERLRYVPGLQTNQVGQAGGSTGLFIRGGGSDANKVLIDGIPVNDIGGNVEFANVASAAVSQVEVLRGPNSALYGSDALAGVVSISTSRGATALPLFTYAIDGGGNFGSYSQEGSVGGRFRKSSTTSPITSASIRATRFPVTLSRRHAGRKLRLDADSDFQSARHDSP